VWHHITVTYSGNNGTQFDDSNIKFYINGVLNSGVSESSSTKPTSYYSIYNPIIVGNIATNTSGGFIGKIASIIFYDKNLTSSEALQTYEDEYSYRFTGSFAFDVAYSYIRFFPANPGFGKVNFKIVAKDATGTVHSWTKSQTVVISKDGASGATGFFTSPSLDLVETTGSLKIGNSLEISDNFLTIDGIKTFIKTKTVDESITSATILQDDEQLWFSGSAGKSYWIDFNLLLRRSQTAANSGTNFSLAGSSGGYMSCPVQGATTTTTTVLANGTSAIQFFPTITGNIAANIPCPVQLCASITLTTDAVIMLKWTQSTSTTNTTTIMKGSQMIIKEVG
jgi:hypothetical protein